MPNFLIGETSPYLLQHAHNPVNWYPWGPAALSKAVEEQKLLLVSIGYSACHWCHVMEHESFEDEEVAAIMNSHFICIKIDREERPDIDQVYMIAVQLMTGSGGWPLHCICLPDQRPVYGGTYFRKGDWKNVLQHLAGRWAEHPAEVEEYAAKLTAGIIAVENPVPSSGEKTFVAADLERLFGQWKKAFDPVEGGYNRAPKFPLPNNWQFMLNYAHLKNDAAAAIMSRITLEKMAFGGIYDHIGGGFARYAVDARWHVPHFEKMLYDNAQLLQLYAEGYQYCSDPLYKEVAYGITRWLLREMTSPEGGFYAALDADSEGIEGKFYTFTRKELVEILGDSEELFSAWFNVSPLGNWEEEQTNIFFRRDNEEELAQQLGLTVGQLIQKVAAAKEKVAAFRTARVRPALDHKILASWNGMMLKGLTAAYRVFNDPFFLDMALKNAAFIRSSLMGEDHSLTRSYPSSTERPVAFLDDYAFVADGFIQLYEVTFDETWLVTAMNLVNYAIANFYDPETGMFYYTPANGEPLIARKFELMDTVIPSSNSAMALNLWKLGHFFDTESLTAMAGKMLRVIYPEMERYPSSYSNWAILLLWEVYGTFEIAVTGPGAAEKRAEIEKYYLPNKIMMGGSDGSLPLLKNKTGETTRIFICKNRTCQLPVERTEDAIHLILKYNTQ